MASGSFGTSEELAKEVPENFRGPTWGGRRPFRLSLICADPNKAETRPPHGIVLRLRSRPRVECSLTLAWTSELSPNSRYFARQGASPLPRRPGKRREVLPAQRAVRFADSNSEPDIRQRSRISTTSPNIRSSYLLDDQGKDPASNAMTFGPGFSIPVGIEITFRPVSKRTPVGTCSE